MGLVWWTVIIALLFITEGQDFIGVDANLTLTTDDSELCMNTSIIDDDRVEGDESFQYMFGALQGSVTIRSDPSECKLIILFTVEPLSKRKPLK